MKAANQPDFIRISVGSAKVLNLQEIKVDDLPTTCYIMSYSENNRSFFGFIASDTLKNAGTVMNDRFVRTGDFVDAFDERVESAGVVGVHDLVHGENVWAYVTLKDGVAASSDSDLIRFARGYVGYKAPEKVIILDEMPLNATGKVDRVTLKKLAADHLAVHHPD